MSPVSIFPPLAVLTIAFATASLLTWKFGAPSTRGRNASIDGLRGYLAILEAGKEPVLLAIVQSVWMSILKQTAARAR
jgi:hypothetical protein